MAAGVIPSTQRRGRSRVESNSSRVPHISRQLARLVSAALMRSWSSTPIPILAGRPAIFRAADPLLTELLDHLFGRYPDDEAATVIRVAWRDTSRGIVLVLQALDLPSDNDVDTSVSHVVLREPYLVRAALNAEEHPFGIGVIHSHPEGASTSASTI